jgi:hypothetical protein
MAQRAAFKSDDDFKVACFWLVKLAKRTVIGDGSVGSCTSGERPRRFLQRGRGHGVSENKSDVERTP